MKSQKKMEDRQKTSSNSRRKFLKDCAIGALAFAISGAKGEEQKRKEPPFRIRTKRLTEKDLEIDPNLAG